MEKKSNGLTIFVCLILIFLLISFFYRSSLVSFLGLSASTMVYEQKTSCHERNSEEDGVGSEDVKVYTNGTNRSKDVTGDLLVKKKTCTVRVTYGQGANDHYDIAPGTKKNSQDSRTVKVARGQEIIIHCLLTENRDKCEWKYSRSSP